MAQLIKLRHFISRYELDIFRYTSRFQRIKRQYLQKQKSTTRKSVGQAHAAEEIFRFQLKWAHSTLKRTSPEGERYEHDKLLKYFLQTFPDNYLLMYHPVFIVHDATCELDLIFISPLEIECVTFVCAKEEAVYTGGSEHFWREAGEGSRRLINPLISSNRTYQVVAGVLQREKIDYPMRQTIVSPRAYLEYQGAIEGIRWVDRRSFRAWTARKTQLRLPMKYRQLQTAKHLLAHCETVSELREE